MTSLNPTPIATWSATLRAACEAATTPLLVAGLPYPPGTVVHILDNGAPGGARWRAATTCPRPPGLPTVAAMVWNRREYLSLAQKYTGYPYTCAVSGLRAIRPVGVAS